MRLMLAAAVLFATPALAQTPRQFDLICTGTQTIVDHEHPDPGGDGPWSTKYVIDLAEGVYCQQDCQKLYHLSAAFPDKLVLVHSAVGGDVSIEQVDRVNGKFFGQWTDRQLGIFRTTSGACAVAPFSGLPSTKF